MEEKILGYSIDDLTNPFLRCALADYPHDWIILPNENDGIVHFYAWGCAGNNSEAQRAVARLKEKIAQQSGKVPNFETELGDNYYNNGVNHYNDPAFNLFYEIYADVESYPLTAHVIIMILGGNHDYGDKHGGLDAKFLKASDWFKQKVKNFEALPDSSKARLANQILFSFTTKGVFDPAKYALYFSRIIELKNLHKYNFPSRFYFFTFINTKFFFCDSSVFVSEFVQFHQGNITEHNQVKVFQDVYDKIDGLIPFKFLFSHHPPLYDLGTREYSSSDPKNYLNDEELAYLKKIGVNVECGYTEIFHQILVDILKWEFDLAISAHAHSESLVVDEKKHYQIVSGGGGAHLQPQRNFSLKNKLKFFDQNHGFWEIKVIQDKIELRCHTVDEYTYVWEIYKKEISSIREPESPETKRFREAVLVGIQHYFDFLDNRQTSTNGSYVKSNISHTDKGIKRANTIRNFFLQYRTYDVVTSMKKVTSLLESSGDNEHSLKPLVEAAIKSEYQKKFEKVLLDQIVDAKKIAHQLTLGFAKKTPQNPNPQQVTQVNSLSLSNGK